MYKIVNNSLFIVFLILMTTLVSCEKEPQQCSDQCPKLKEDDIKKIATNITVKINWQYPGSGFIIKRKEDNGKYMYTVLTARHIVGTKPPKQGIDVSSLPPEEAKKLGQISNNKIDAGDYTVSIFDEKDQPTSYKIKSYENQIFLDDKLDLAVLTFDSNQKYEVAKISKSIINNSSSYLYGFKACMGNPSISKIKEFNIGKIILTIPEESVKEGYGVEYSNLSILGMSGSPVFNSYGEVIAMHGARKSDNINKFDEGRNSILKDCREIPKNFSPNLGISMSKFKNSDLAKKIGI